MLDGPVRCIGSIYVQLNADLEDLDGLLPVEVVVSNSLGSQLRRNDFPVSLA